MITAKDISAIIPVAGEEPELNRLIRDLRAAAGELEVLISPPSEGKRGRALQMNAGAARACRPFLWFLHADTRLSPSAPQTLLTSLNRWPGALHYFILKFFDGPPWMRLNEIGCRIRSRFFGLPFGDQGFAVAKKIFDRIGGFPVETLSGEDHLFVWRARQKGIGLRCTGSPLFTSARRYVDEGWWRVTGRYARLWTKQAWGEWKKSWTMPKTS